ASRLYENPNLPPHRFWQYTPRLGTAPTTYTRVVKLGMRGRPSPHFFDLHVHAQNRTFCAAVFQPPHCRLYKLFSCFRGYAGTANNPPTQRLKQDLPTSEN